MPKKSSTPRQHDVLAAIGQSQQAHGYVPTVRELCELVHLASTARSSGTFKHCSAKGIS